MSGYKVIENGRVLTIEDGTMPQYYIVNNETDKPPNPSIGDVCRVTGNLKEYSCFIANLWTLTNSPCITRYYNHSGSNDNVMTPTLYNTGTAGTGAPHILYADSGDAAGGSMGSWKVNIVINPATNHFKFTAKLGALTAGVGGTRLTYVGLIDDPTTYYVDPTGVYFRQTDDFQWEAVTNDTAVGIQTSDAGNLVDTDDLTILGMKDQILFFVNGVLVGNHVNNIVATAMYPGFMVLSTDATITTNRLVKIDDISIEVMK